MKTSGIIAEYNPFHLGHKYQINKIKKGKTKKQDLIFFKLGGGALTFL